MSITLENMQEVGFHVDHGRSVFARVITETSVLVTREYVKDEQGHERPGPYRAMLTTFSVATGETISIGERSFTTIDELMEIIDVSDVDEVWQFLD